MPRVFVTRILPSDELDRLTEAGHEVDVWPGDMPPSPEDLRERAASAEALLSLVTDRVDGALLDAAPNLRVVANYAVGSDNIDLAAARERNIPVGVTPDVLTGATADLAFALILAAARKIVDGHEAVREGRWHTWEPQGWLGLELEGATLLVAGAGRIGTAVARRAEGFGMRVLTFDLGDDLHAMLPEADVVTIHLPLTDETRGLFGTEVLRAMKPTAILVNSARGPIVDQDALRAALHAGELGAAALDVTDPEPLPADHPLLDAPNLLVLPHVGSATHTARRRMAERAVDNVLAGLDGQPLPFPAQG